MAKTASDGALDRVVPEQVFKDIRVLDVGHIVAGPFAASVMGDFGADVIKIERPKTGDPLRWLYPKNGAGLFFKMQGRNKRCITLDLKRPQGRDIFHRLVKRSDVLVENFRPGVMERLGNDWETLRAVNPRLVFCRLSGFGQTGPYAGRRAFGQVAEAFSGLVNITGDKGKPPVHPLMALGDTVAGAWAAMGVMMALYWRDARGGNKGQVIDVGLFEPLFRTIEQQIVIQDQLGITLERMGSENPANPFVGLYATADGRYFSFSANTTPAIDSVLRALALEGDERFNAFERCLANRDAFQQAVRQWMAVRSLQEIVAAFAAQEAPGSAVMDSRQLMSDPHVLARDMVVTVPDPEVGPLRMQGIVPKLSETPGRVRHAGQAMGTANEEVYRGLLGMTTDEMSALQEQGII